MIVAFSIGLLLAAIGCDKGNDNKEEPTLAGAIAGTYVGNLTMGESVVGQNVAITVTEKNETTVTLGMNTTLPDLPNVGDLPLDVTCDATVTKDGNDYKVAGTTTIEIPQMGTFPVTVTIAGPITAAGAATLEIRVTIITVVFSGTKQ